MSGADWERLQEAFAAAVAVPVDRREQRIRDLAAGDADFERELRELVGHHHQTDGPLDRWSDAGGTDARLKSAPLGIQIGHYVLMRVVAVGGTSTVYEAACASTGRTVALKMLSWSSFSEAARARFSDEVAILSKLDHPGIARIVEAGVDAIGEGAERRELPYFALEFVRGARTIREYAEREALSLEARTRLFLNVCAAVAYGHGEGVIHRDLKPDNILVDGEGVPRVIDFGIARFVSDESTRHTRTGQLLGTLRYMSPEQIAASPAELDVRTDVYSLGVVLYELLFRRPPYPWDGEPPHEVARMIREREPVNPLADDPTLPRSLVWVVLRCLEKDRERRYDSVEDLQRDLQRALDGGTVTARAPRQWDRLCRWVRHNRRTAALSVTTLVSVLVGIVLLVVGLQVAERMRAEAEEQERAAEAATEFLTRMLTVARPMSGAPAPTLREVVGAASVLLEERFGDDIATRAKLHRTLGLTYLGLYLWQEARDQLEAALSLQEQLRDADGCVVAYVDLAHFHRQQGDVETATVQLDDAGEWLRDSAVSEGTRIDHQFERARCWAESRLVTEAIKVIERVLAWRMSNRGPLHSTTQEAWIALADAQRREGRWYDALLQLEELAVQCRSVPSNPLPLLETLFAQADVLVDAGRHEEATVALSESLEVCEVQLTSRHPLAIRALRRLGNLKRLLARHREAEIHLKVAVQRARGYFGAEHSVTLDISLDLAQVLFRAGQLREAQRLATEVADRAQLAAEDPGLPARAQDLLFMIGPAIRDG